MIFFPFASLKIKEVKKKMIISREDGRRWLREVVLGVVRKELGVKREEIGVKS
jgi:hypothetical protein